MEEDIVFESDEFIEVGLEMEFYCSCGCQLFEDDEFCPNCGRKVDIKEITEIKIDKDS